MTAACNDEDPKSRQKNAFDYFGVYGDGRLFYITCNLSVSFSFLLLRLCENCDLIPNLQQPDFFSPISYIKRKTCRNVES